MRPPFSGRAGAGLAAFLALGGTTPLLAQRSFCLSAAGGIGVPIGELEEDYRPGPGGGLAATVFIAGGRLGIRADLGVVSLEAHDATPSTPRFTPMTMTGSLVVHPVPGGVVHPYLVAGAGLVTGGRPGDSGDPALQGGLGIEFGRGRARLVLEGRLVTGAGDAWVPVTAGLSLRL